MNRWHERELFEMLAPVKALEQDIQQATMLRPTALMLPLSVLPGADHVLGLAVFRGDRIALIYEPGGS